MTRTTLALVDDHRVVSRSLQAYLESFPDMLVVGIATSGEELLANLARWRPQIVLQDLLMPGGIDGIETTRRIVEQAPDVRVIALTASTDEEVLLTAVRTVAAGRTFIDPVISRQLKSSAAGPDLTGREREVLRLLGLGRSNRDIALALDVGEETVKTHVAHLFSKLEVENRAQATVQALRRGLISLEDLA
jgi:NarL family two-component system response regulator LiaR